ncbi:MAG: TIGR03960 family B12-binding radical SAM protein [Thermodesulfobacteriota bacterium]|nr:TIGR03960 family B12-binding radical SAM protein [Thermodesulfobacteriota bacterium]
MNRQSLDMVLPLIRNPSRYLGSEINAIRKDPAKVRLRFALAFPDLYEVGMSHVGIQILYHILNARKEIAAERVFAPGLDLEAELRERQIPLSSLETQTPLSGFDIIGFSLLYELNFTNILTILDRSNIPFYATDRDHTHPFVVAGGPCTFNPEPLADFFDAMVIGDGEVAVVELADAWLKWKEAAGDREQLLREWSRVRGVYVPSFFDPQENKAGLQVLTPRFSDHTAICKVLVSDLNEVPYPDHPVIPFGNPIHNRLSLEICRGCTRGCRFCQAGMIYRPVRERAPETILSLAQESLAHTGYEDLSLLSLSTGDYGAIEVLMERLMGRCEPEKISVSLPSLRIGTLTDSLMAQIKRVRKTGFTVAPEAGSQRLRDVINKGITEEALEETVRNAFGLGWQLIKLYFMIGLPTETATDLEAIVALAKRLQRVPAPGRRNKNITVSVSTFIPKPHTPFQWCPQISLAESKERLQMLRSRLRGRGLRFKWQTPEMSILEGLFARGDRRLSRLLVKAYEIGCRFDGWSDHFNYERWKEAIDACGVDLPFYTTRTRDLSEPLPWDHIDSGVTKTYLKEEWEKAMAGAFTPDCRQGDCNLCGVCDLEVIKPVTFEPESAVTTTPIPQKKAQPPLFKKLQVSFAKQGPARYFGHLELMKIFMRALRRAKIPMRFSEGFHPAPKISFESALPVGIESTREHFFLEVPLHVQKSSLMDRVNEELPEGLTITGCTDAPKHGPKQGPSPSRYTVTLKEEAFSEQKLNDFVKSNTWPLTKTNRKGRTKTVDLKEVVAGLRMVSASTMQMTLHHQSGAHASCKDALSAIFGLSDRALAHATIIKEPASAHP